MPAKARKKRKGSGSGAQPADGSTATVEQDSPSVVNAPDQVAPEAVAVDGDPPTAKPQTSANRSTQDVDRSNAADLPPTPRSMADLIEELTQFSGAPEAFLQLLLVRQCEIAEASAGAILRQSEGAGVEPIAVYPETQSPGGFTWLTHAASKTQTVCSQGITLVTALALPDAMYEQRAKQYLIMVPLLGDGGPRGAIALLVETDDVRAVNAASQRIELTVSLLHLYEMRLSLDRGKSNLARLGKVVEVIAATNEQSHLKPAAIALCSQVVSQWDADRASIGFLRHRSIRLAAMNHTDRFSRKMKLVQSIESTMEESVDQDTEVMFPAARESSYVCRAAGELSAKYGPTCVLTLPLRHRGEPIGALTIERSPDRPFTFSEAEAIRLLCDLSTSRLWELNRQARWIGAKLADGARDAGAMLVGAKHTWAKLAAIVLIVSACFLTFATGRYQVESTFAFEASRRHYVPAPFTGYLAEVNVEAGDRVAAGETVLATIDTTQIQLRLAQAEAERAANLTMADQALDDGEKVKEQVARAEAAKLQAEIDLLKDQIGRAVIAAPIDGVVLVGDLQRRLGSQIETGETLYEIAPLDNMRATLWLPEDRIAEIEEGQPGSLASASHPSERLRFVVNKIHPIAKVKDQQNVFEVEVELLDTRPWIRPGMEGVAKIDAGERKLAWIWTRGLINWARMKLWI